MSDRQTCEEIIKDNLSQYGEFGISTELKGDCARIHLYSEENLDREDMNKIGETIRDILMPSGKYDFNTNNGCYEVRVASPDYEPQTHL